MRPTLIAAVALVALSSFAVYPKADTESPGSDATAGASAAKPSTAGDDSTYSIRHRLRTDDPLLLAYALQSNLRDVADAKVNVDVDNRELRVQATADIQQKVEKLLDVLDDVPREGWWDFDRLSPTAPKKPPRGAHSPRLRLRPRHLDATLLGHYLRSRYSKENISIAAGAAEQKLYVFASATLLEEIDKLVERLDLPTEKRPRSHEFETHAVAQAAAAQDASTAEGTTDAGPTSGAAGDKEPAATPTGGQADLPADASTIKIFNLQRADAVEMAAILSKLYPDLPAKLTADPRTNTIIARGPEELLMVIEAILLKLDGIDARSPAGSAPASGSAGTAVKGGAGGDAEGLSRLPPSALSEQYRTHDQRAGVIADELRNRQSKAGPDDPQLKQLRAQLKDEITAAFVARQKLQQAELEQLRRRLGQIERLIQAREQLKAEIIERRADDLLNPARQWDPGSEGPASGQAAGTDQFVPHAGSSQQSSDSRRESNAANEIPAAGIGENRKLRAPLADDPRKALLDAEAGVNVARAALAVAEAELTRTDKGAERIQSLVKKGYAGQSELEAVQSQLVIDRARLDRAKSDVTAAERQLEWAREQLQNYVKLLTQDLTAAKMEFEYAATQEARFRALKEKNAIAQQELDEKHLATERARHAASRAETLLDLYRRTLPAGSTGDKGQSSPQDASSSLAPVDKKAQVEGELSAFVWEQVGIKLEPAPAAKLAGSTFRGGLTITELRDDGPAENAGIRVGDLLVGLGRWETRSLDNVGWILNRAETREALSKGHGVETPTYLLRDGASRMAPVHLRPADAAQRDAASQPSTNKSSSGQPRSSLYKHDKDFRWIRGKVARDGDTRAWRITFSMSPPPQDKYSGSFELIADPNGQASPFETLEEGSSVLVEGKIDEERLDPYGKPRYRVANLQRIRPRE